MYGNITECTQAEPDGILQTGIESRKRKTEEEILSNGKPYTNSISDNFSEFCKRKVLKVKDEKCLQTANNLS